MTKPTSRGPITQRTKRFLKILLERFVIGKRDSGCLRLRQIDQILKDEGRESYSAMKREEERRDK